VVSEPVPVVEAEPEPSVSLPPIALTRSKIVLVRRALVVAKPVPLQVVASPEAVIAPQPEVIIRPVDLEVKPSLNWQPVGYLALAVGGAAGVVGAGLLLKRTVRIRRLRFS
jgi:hypothetical protein